MPMHAAQQKLGLPVEGACGGAALEVGLSDEGLREGGSGAEGPVVGVVVGDDDDDEGKGRERRPASRLLFRRRSRSASSSLPMPPASSAVVGAAGAPPVAVASLGRRGAISSTVTDWKSRAGRQARAVVSACMQGRSSVALNGWSAVVSARMQGRSSVAISVPGRVEQAGRVQPFARAHRQGT